MIWGYQRNIITNIQKKGYVNNLKYIILHIQNQFFKNIKLLKIEGNVKVTRIKKTLKKYS